MGVVGLIFLILLSCSSSYMFKALNFSLYDVYAYNVRERVLLYWMYTRENRVTFLNLLTNEAVLPMTAVVNTQFAEKFEEGLQRGGIQYHHRYSNHLLEAEALERLIKNIAVEPGENFMTLNAIQNWIDTISISSPIIEKKVIGLTYNREDIVLLKLSTGHKNIAVLITGGEDGKDWMSTAVLLNFVYNLVQNSTYLNILEYYDVYIIPNSNPDGYKYNSEVDRFWSKNRKVLFPQKFCPDDTIYGTREAVGVNIDRNWFTHEPDFDEDMECDVIFAGEDTVSELESKALYEFINTIATKLMAFVNVKGYGKKVITIPYAYNELTNNHYLMMELLASVSGKLKEKFNESYFYGSTASFLYKYYGNAADWVKSKLNVPVVYTVHMQWRDLVFPNTMAIEFLTDELSTILNETLILAKDIYGPLFNKQANNPVIYVTFLIVLVFISCMI